MPRTSRSSDGRLTPKKTSAPTPRLTSVRAPASGVPSSPPLPSSRSHPASASRASSAASAVAIPGSSRFPATTPTDPDRRHASARAALFGIYPSVLAASHTLILSWSLTASGRVSARDADAVDTAAARATSVSVAWLPRELGRRLPIFVTVAARLGVPCRGWANALRTSDNATAGAISGKLNENAYRKRLHTPSIELRGIRSKGPGQRSNCLLGHGP